jgi:hypothetical protein
MHKKIVLFLFDKGKPMPVVFRYEGFRFFFYSNEGQPREPTHIHVRSSEGEAKFWLYPTVHLADSHGFDAGTLRELAKIVEQHVSLIEPRKGSWTRSRVLFLMVLARRKSPS